MSKVALAVFCVPCYQRFYSFWFLLFEFPFDLFHMTWTSFFCESGFFRGSFMTMLISVVCMLLLPLPSGLAVGACPPRRKSSPSVLKHPGTTCSSSATFENVRECLISMNVVWIDNSTGDWRDVQVTGRPDFRASAGRAVFLQKRVETEKPGIISPDLTFHSLLLSSTLSRFLSNLPIEL